MGQPARILCRRTALGVAALLLTAAPSLTHPVGAFDDPGSRATLKGITAVQVVLDLDGNVEVGNPIWADQIEAQLLLRLRKAGITVAPSAPTWLHIAIYLYRVSPDNPGYAHTIHTQFLQWVRLTRDFQITTHAATWDIGSIGWIPDFGPGSLGFLESSVGSQVDRFIHAYLEQNPRR